MPKNLFARIALGTALVIALSPTNTLQAQSTGTPPPPPGITTGGDPQPIKPATVSDTIIPMLIAILAG